MPLEQALRDADAALARVRRLDPLYLKGQTAADIYRKMVEEDKQLKEQIKARLKNSRKRLGRKPRTDCVLVFSRAEKKREQARLRMQRMRRRNKTKQPLVHTA